MIYEIDYSKLFKKELSKAIKPIRLKAIERIEELRRGIDNPLHEIHPLHAEYAGYKSCNVTGDRRIIFRIEGNTLFLRRLGTHPQLYG